MNNEEQLQTEAAELVLRDLIDCLLAEGLFDAAHPQLLPASEWPPALGTLPQGTLVWQWTLAAAPLDRVVVPVVRGIAQPVQCAPGIPAQAWRIAAQDEPAALDPAGLVRLLIAHAPDSFIRDNEQGAAMFLDWIEDSVRQTAWSLAHAVDTATVLEGSAAAAFRTLEQCASLRDRPFHPVAKAKKGFDRADYHAYMAEFGREVPLRWVAVRADSVACGNGVDDPRETRPERFLLDDGERQALHAEMAARGIGASHVALPVHPWQLAHVLPKMLPAELADGTCVPLDFAHGGFVPTSSVRSLAPVSSSHHHLKLPLGIHSLGASRYLPAIKMINGQRSESLLRRALALDPVLTQRVFLCDETKWWAYLPEQATLFDEGPRHLAAMVRSYPHALTQDAECRLVPMAALGVPLAPRDTHFFDAWLRQRRLPAEPGPVLALLRELCEVFFDINLRMFRLGLLAEVHGQNAVLVWRAGRATGLLLRDHDSLRVHVPWLERQGLADPEYQLKPGHANTLYHATPEDLLFYLQTLAIQVNVRAIFETAEARYGVAASQAWAMLRDVLEQAIERIDFGSEARAMLRDRLFDAPEWPLKLLVRPMIERAAGPGSMPFGKSVTSNPFQAAPAHHATPPEDSAAAA
ncbi:IucA/IucC family protein [Pseudoduganella flava]|uniref:IucA/IucC family protein n=1 Tax=Pseudoduganella flava TaxID=871742 RepID=UPI0018EEFAA5|nr:IucA/IucC family protein [Pseudoduganella flava]